MNGKKLKIAVLFLLLIFSGLFAWDQYMKATWDHHIVGAPSTYSLSGNKPLFIRNVMNSKETEDFIEKNTLEIIKKGGEYFWVNNGNKKLVKTEIVKEINERRKKTINPEYANFLIFTNLDGYGSVEIETSNNLAITSSVGGSENYCWHSSNYVERKKSDDGNVSIYEGIAPIYTSFYKRKAWRMLFCDKNLDAIIGAKF